MTDPMITFTVVGYGYEYEWHVFINSLLLQTDDRWKCDLINDGPDSLAEEICGSYVERFPDKFSFRCTDQRYDDWGHSLRDMGLREVTTKYWSTQNADNYLMPTFVEYTVNYLEDHRCDMVVFPCVHNYPNVNPPKSPPYSVLNVAPKKNRCDAGSLVINTILAQSVGWRHRINQADGEFIEDIMRLYPRPKVRTMENVLMVHN